jgi:predicted protein tyrosine phosphatase
MAVGRNRLNATRDQYQGTRKRVLAICSGGLLRSPTAAWLLGNDPWGFNTRAAGLTKEYALIYADEALLYWAEEVVVFDASMQQEVRYLLSQYMNDGSVIPVHNVEIEDDYDFRQPELVELLTEKFLKIWPENA